MWQVTIHPDTRLFMDNLEIHTREKIRHAIDLLGEYGYLLRTPHSKKMAGYPNLFELRTSGNSPIRLFYTSHKNTFYVLHGFIKKSDKTPQNEINMVVKRQKKVDSSLNYVIFNIYMKYVKWETIEKKWMKNLEFRRIAKKLEPEYQLASSLIATRIKRRMSQAAIAKKAGTDQASISRLESGASKPSLTLLRKVATALNARLMVRFET